LKKEFKDAFDDYEKRKLIMSEQKRAETEKELVRLEENISKFRQSKFGANGELFKNQEEIMKPIQNKIFNIIQEVAEEEDLDFVFDRSGDILFLYAKEEYDITNLVLEKLK
jgi:outer membrane protein